MKKNVFSFILVFMFCAVSAQNNTSDIYRIIPLPQNINLGNGESFKLTSSTKISFPKNDVYLKQMAVFLSDYIQMDSGLKVSISDFRFMNYSYYNFEFFLFSYFNTQLLRQNLNNKDGLHFRNFRTIVMNNSYYDLF